MVEEAKQTNDLAPEYVEFQEKLKGLMVDYGESILESVKGDKEFIKEKDLSVIESIIGTLNAGIKAYEWDRYARDINGNPVFLARKFDLTDKDAEGGFKFVLEGINSDYKEVFKSRAERERAIIEGGMVIYNG